MVRSISLHVGVLALLIATIHSLIWWGPLDSEWYYAIPPLFFAYLGLSLIIRRLPSTWRKRRAPDK